MCKTAYINADDFQVIKLLKMDLPCEIKTYGIDNMCNMLAKDILATNIYTAIYVSKKYPYINEKNVKELPSKEVKDIKNNIKSLIAYKIGNACLNGTDNILISMLIGITTVGLYSNYYLIIS